MQATTFFILIFSPLEGKILCWFLSIIGFFFFPLIILSLLQTANVYVSIIYFHKGYCPTKKCRFLFIFVICLYLFFLFFFSRSRLSNIHIWKIFSINVLTFTKMGFVRVNYCTLKDDECLNLVISSKCYAFAKKWLQDCYGYGELGWWCA